MTDYELIIIGGGPAGLAAGISARRNGIEHILILERDKELGGILNQCIHNGFGLHTFQEELTGPEYADRYIQEVRKLRIECRLNTMVLDISPERKVTAVNPSDGMFEIQAQAVILAMGCRERPRGALNIPGYRPAGIFSAGTAQRLVNIEGYMPGKEVVILGSGDIGLIMARRMTLEGASVKAVAELMPYSSGLKRNIVQCLDDYGIPLMLSHTVVRIWGKERLEGITLAEVDEKGRPIPGTEEEISCDTLLLSVGLIPENELSKDCGIVLDPSTKGPEVNESLETTSEGIFACGNVLHVHDLVDYVSEEAELAGKYAAQYIKESKASQPVECIKEGKNGQSAVYRKEEKSSRPAELIREIRLITESGVSYTVPQKISPARMPEQVTVRFRVRSIFHRCSVGVYFGEKCIVQKKRLIMAPGEMESIMLSREKLREFPEIKTITIRIEEQMEEA